MNNIKFVVAMESEAEMLRKHYPDEDIIVVGVGVANVITNFSRRIPRLPKDTIFINVGYAGTNLPLIKVGEAVLVDTVKPEFISNVISETPREVCLLAPEGITCYTSDDFVTKTEHNGVFDMELFYLALFESRKIISVKLISDNLCYQQFEKFNEDAAWESAYNLLDTIIPVLRDGDKNNIIY